MCACILDKTHAVCRQLAAHLAEVLFGPAASGGGGSAEKVKECFVQLQMNQYQDERSIDSLIGPPVGVRACVRAAVGRAAVGQPP
eukprot:SAG22_NODE_209_length_15177_cov_9.282995_2_plen_85_part_00